MQLQPGDTSSTLCWAGLTRCHPWPQGLAPQEGVLGFKVLVLLQQKLPGFGVLGEDGTWLMPGAACRDGIRDAPGCRRGGAAAAAASSAGHCQTPAQGRLGNQTTNAPPRAGGQSPSLFPWGPVLQAPTYLPDCQTLLLSLAKAMICCDHGAAEVAPAPCRGSCWAQGHNPAPGSDIQGIQGCAGATAGPWAISKGRAVPGHNQGAYRGAPGAATGAELQQALLWDS